MAFYEDETHFRLFAGNLESAIKRYEALPEESLLVRQRRQLQLLLDLEKKFRKTLIKHPWGPSVYRDFLSMILDKKRNILAARPYFRERQSVFASKISNALKQRSDKGLYQFRFNYSFVLFVLQAKNWKSNKIGGKIVQLAKEINDIRMEIMEMNMPLAISQARIFWSNTPKSHLSYMDLIQIHCGGLLVAIDKFVPPDTSEMSEAEELEAYRKFRAVAIGRMVGDRIEQYSIDADTILNPCNQPPKKIQDFKPGDQILGIDSDGQTIVTDVLALHDHGIQEGLEVAFSDGYKIICTAKHKFLTERGMVSLEDILRDRLEILYEPAQQAQWMASPMRSPDVLTAESGVVQQSPLLPEERLSEVAYSDAPLTNTGSLALRKIVRVRSVGPKHMYDLEVDHPKHNFLLPNGIVTSNSETLIHFYPVDKRKIYRANKARRRMGDAIDYSKMAESVNEDVEKNHQTNPEEIAELLAASSCVSGDVSVDPEGETTLDRYEANEENRPDLQAEEADAIIAMRAKIQVLPLVERKLLRMRGIPQ